MMQYAAYFVLAWPQKSAHNIAVFIVYFASMDTFQDFKGISLSKALT